MTKIHVLIRRGSVANSNYRLGMRPKGIPRKFAKFLFSTRKEVFAHFRFFLYLQKCSQISWWGERVKEIKKYRPFTGTFCGIKKIEGGII